MDKSNQHQYLSNLEPIKICQYIVKKSALSDSKYVIQIATHPA